MKHRIALLLSVCAAMVVMASAVQAAALTLVEDGRARCAVVVADDASASEKWAAEEFVLHVRQMSGAQIETLSAAPADGRVALVIGAKSLPANDPLLRTLDELGEEGYAIQSRKGALVIAGGSLRGTMYGVFTLLEHLGVRWWTPAETYIPKIATVKVADINLREKPAMEYRDLMFRETWDGEAARKWYAHNKLNGYGWEKGPEKMGRSYRFHGNLVHSYMNLLKLSGMEIKPEMLALRGNSRQSTQPCLTNPDTVKAMVAGVLKAYEKEPTAHFVVVGQQDNDAYASAKRARRWPSVRIRRA